MISKESNPIFFYHDDADGFGCAWVASKYFSNVEFYEVSYNKTNLVNPQITNRDIFICDFFIPPEYIIKNKPASITILDHHQSTYDKWAGVVYPNLTKVFDFNKSACRITFEYFFPQQEVPELILYIEDRDLWNNKMLHTEEINLVVHRIDKQFGLWDNIQKKLKNNFSSVVSLGSILLENKKADIQKISNTNKDITIFGHRCKIISSAVLVSDIGSYINDIYKCPAVIWNNYGENISISFRTNNIESVSALELVDLISKNFSLVSYGGHKNAAGLTIKSDIGLELIRSWNKKVTPCV
jgi:oligoribonuclease NrnB/cAMP/cGMP phosphodiesterase (DHH superfamily)